MSDDATGGARQGDCASPRFQRALDLSKPRRVVRIDLDGAKWWLGPRWGHLYEAALLRRLDKRWFHTHITLDGYEGPPGSSRGAKFLQLTVEQALLLCTDEKIDPPPELIEEYESACSLAASPARAGRSQETPNKDREGELPKSPQAKPKRRGRQKGVNYVNLALTEVAARLKDDRPVGVSDIARAVGCTPENLNQSKRFVQHYLVRLWQLG